MKLSATKITRLLRKKIATAALIVASAAAFATIGDSGKKGQTRPAASSKFSYNSKNFTLRSSYNFKGNNVLNTHNSPKFIVLNTTVTYQKGNTTYVLPLKKKVILDKVNFNPAAQKH